MGFNINNVELDKVGNDLLFVSVDFCNDDIGVLIVGRQRGEVTEIINQFSGDKAIGIYALLTNYAEMINEKDIPKKVVSYSDDESDHVYCPRCHECIGSNEIVYDDFYYRGWTPMYCQECGQAMIWK